MYENFDKEIKDAFPPTPQEFTARMRKTLGVLPKRKQHTLWKALASVATAAAACALFAFIFSQINLPAKDIVSTPHPTAAAQTTAGAPDDESYPPAPPPVGPLPQLAVTDMGSLPSSPGGWQAVAQNGGVNWYFNPGSGEIARAEAGKAVSVKLDLARGQSVDTYTFLPAQDGRWAAFTVHAASGDAVWLVTSDGRKMVVPDDVHWMDYNWQPIQIDLSGAAMFPFDCRLEAPADQEDIDADSMIDDFSICAVKPDGTVYFLQVGIDTYKGYQAFSLNDRRGYCTETEKLGAGEAAVASTETIYTMDAGRDGVFKISDESGAFQPPSVTLQSNRFALFRAADDGAPGASLTCALLIYKDDPDHALWELDMGTGTATKVADGCLAAGWLSSTAYWYSTEADSAQMIQRDAAGLKTVGVTAHIKPAVYPSDYPSDMAGKTTLIPEIWIQNNTDAGITLPDAAQWCSLEITRDGTVVWQQQGDFKLSDGKYRYRSIGKIGDAGEQAGAGPYTLKPGYELGLEFMDVVWDQPGVYMLSGEFYGQQVNYRITLPVE